MSSRKKIKINESQLGQSTTEPNNVLRTDCFTEPSSASDFVALGGAEEQLKFFPEETPSPTAIHSHMATAEAVEYIGFEPPDTVVEDIVLEETEVVRDKDDFVLSEPEENFLCSREASEDVWQKREGKEEISLFPERCEYGETIKAVCGKTKEKVSEVVSGCGEIFSGFFASFRENGAPKIKTAVLAASSSAACGSKKILEKSSVAASGLVAHIRNEMHIKDVLNRMQTPRDSPGLKRWIFTIVASTSLVFLFAMSCIA